MARGSTSVKQTVIVDKCLCRNDNAPIRDIWRGMRKTHLCNGISINVVALHLWLRWRGSIDERWPNVLALSMMANAARIKVADNINW